MACLRAQYLTIRESSHTDPTSRSRWLSFLRGLPVPAPIYENNNSDRFRAGCPLPAFSGRGHGHQPGGCAGCRTLNRRRCNIRWLPGHTLTLDFIMQTLLILTWIAVLIDTIAIVSLCSPNDTAYRKVRVLMPATCCCCRGQLRLCVGGSKLHKSLWSRPTLFQRR